VVQLDAIIQGNANASTKPRFVIVVSDVPEYVLAFRRYEADAPPNEVIAQTLYDALIAKRQLEQLVPNGLTWRLPASIASAIPPPTDVQAFCAALNLPIELATSKAVIISDLQAPGHTRSPVVRSPRTF